LLLGGQRVLPNKALSNGFVFRHETLRSAFEAVLRSDPGRKPAGAMTVDGARSSPD
jgi:hypothetical protein